MRRSRTRGKIEIGWEGRLLMRLYKNKTFVILLSLSVAACLGLIWSSAQSKLITNVPRTWAGMKSSLSSWGFWELSGCDNGWKVDSFRESSWRLKPNRSWKWKIRWIYWKWKSFPATRMTWMCRNGPHREGEKEREMPRRKISIPVSGHQWNPYPRAPQLDWKDKTPKLTFNPSTGKDEQERGWSSPGRRREYRCGFTAAVTLYHGGLGQGLPRGDAHSQVRFAQFCGLAASEGVHPDKRSQEFESFPQTRILKITRFVVRAVPNAPREELMEVAYLFFDQVKCWLIPTKWTSMAMNCIRFSTADQRAEKRNNSRLL